MIQPNSVKQNQNGESRKQVLHLSRKNQEKKNLRVIFVKKFYT